MAANSGVELEVLIHDGGTVLSLVAKLLWLGKRKRLKRKVKCLKRELAAAQSTDWHLRHLISTGLERYFVLKDRGSDLVLQSAESFEFDGRPEWIPDMLEQPVIHDEDYRIFRFLTDPGEVFLDIGANRGYSAASVWATGAKCAVLSFEPIVAFETSLEAIAVLRPGRFDYRIMGLGAEARKARFVTPVLNGCGVSALTTAAEAPDLHTIAVNLEDYIVQWMGARRDITLRFFEFEAPIETLDGVLERDDFRVPLDRVAAIKIGTEGFESAVVRGAIKTLRKHRPLVMVEGANRVPDLDKMMADLGYFYADRDGDVLRPFAGVSRCNNGFFIHRDRAPEYRGMGLLVDSGKSAQHDPSFSSESNTLTSQSAYRQIAQGESSASKPPSTGAENQSATLRDDLEAELSSHHNRTRELVIAEFLQYVDVEGKRILEVGSDTALSIASLFIEHGAKEVICTNPFEPPLVPIDNPKIRFFLERAEDIGFSDGYFDIIYGTSVLEHIHDVEKFFARMSSLLKDDGLLCLEGNYFWTTMNGHHLFVYDEQAGAFYACSDLDKCPIKAYEHLYYGPEGMRSVLSERGIPDSHIKLIIDHLETSPHINRLSPSTIKSAAEKFFRTEYIDTLDESLIDSEIFIHLRKSYSKTDLTLVRFYMFGVKPSCYEKLRGSSIRDHFGRGAQPHVPGTPVVVGIGRRKSVCRLAPSKPLAGC
jgi:FkbM family methyltransferase